MKEDYSFNLESFYDEIEFSKESTTTISRV